MHIIHQADGLATEWESKALLPRHLWYGDWGAAAAYAVRHQVVERHVQLHVVPADYVPGSTALAEVPLSLGLWLANVFPTNDRCSALQLEVVTQ